MNQMGESKDGDDMKLKNLKGTRQNSGVLGGDLIPYASRMNRRWQNGAILDKKINTIPKQPVIVHCSTLIYDHLQILSEMIILQIAQD